MAAKIVDLLLPHETHKELSDAVDAHANKIADLWKHLPGKEKKRLHEQAFLSFLAGITWARTHHNND